MKLKYKILLKEGASVSFSTGSESIRIDNDINLAFETDSNKVLSRIVIEVSNQQIKYDQQGLILTEYSEINDRLFPIITYISNSIYTQTTIDALDPHNKQNYSAELFPETPQEQEELETRKKSVERCLAYSWNIEGYFQIKEFKSKLPHTTPVAHYANALRTVSLLQKYEQFYKVIECFFGDKRGDEFDRAVSKHVLQHDKMYAKAKIKAFRELRVQLVHPKLSNELHLSSENPEAFRKVEAHLLSIQRLAKLLLDNPPSP